MTAYFDPILQVHHRLPVTFAMTYCFYLAPQVPDEARRLFDAAVVGSGISRDGVGDLGAHRINAMAWFLAREWGIRELEDGVRGAIEQGEEPTWDRGRGEFTWGLGLGEEHPRGQYNGFLAAAEALSAGGWERLSAAPLAGLTARSGQPQQSGEPGLPGLVEGVDFPAVALGEARWLEGTLRLGVRPRGADVEGETTEFRITGLADPSRWRVEGEARLEVRGRELIVETAVRNQRLVLLPTE